MTKQTPNITNLLFGSLKRKKYEKFLRTIVIFLVKIVEKLWKSKNEYKTQGNQYYQGFKATLSEMRNG